jgi:DNA-binding transcriptional LysR family regulator
MLDYSALAALAAVVREGSFDRAARALHVTPSAISQRIRGLEERMGCALVVRAQPCRATDTGRRLCQHMDRVQLLEHELHGALPALAADGMTRAPLPIAVNADSLATWLAPAIARFAAQAPVLLDVAVDDQDHTGEWLRSGAVLAAVSSAAHPAAGCNSRPLGAMRYVAAASPAFVRAHEEVLERAVDAWPHDGRGHRLAARERLRDRPIQAVAAEHVDAAHAEHDRRAEEGLGLARASAHHELAVEHEHRTAELAERAREERRAQRDGRWWNTVSRGFTSGHGRL